LSKKALLYGFCLLTLAGLAQSKKRNFRQRELGFFGGGSYYIGDINPRGHFTATHPAGGVFFRYTTNYRFAFRFGLNAGTISGDDANSIEADQRERNLNFKSSLYELHSLAEFNFVEYRIGHDRYRFTMFVFAGLAGFYFNPQTNNGVYLRDQRSEGQGKGFPKFQFSVPFGVGLKWNVGERCGLGVEWGPRHTYTDYLDDIKGSYPELPTAGESPSVTNVTNTPGNMRGNPSTKDWYFFYGVTFNVKLRDPHRPCHKGF
jgi:hypothetical protein